MGTIFDQRGQTVTYQYNAAGDINFGAVQTRHDLVGELQKLKSEVGQAHSAGVFDEDVKVDTEYELAKAIAKVKKNPPNKQDILLHISNARTLLESIGAATGLVAGFIAAAEAVQKFFLL